MAQIGTRKLTLEIDELECAPEVSSCVIAVDDADSDFTSFLAASLGGSKSYSLDMTLAQNAATGSLWSMIFSEAGTAVPVTVRPYGNAVPSASEPHFTGEVTISEPSGPLLGGDADPSPTSRMTVEVSWLFTSKPTRVTA